MNWKHAGLALAAAAIATAVPIAAAHPDGNGDNNPNRPGHGVPSQARDGIPPGVVFHTIQPPGLKTALSQIPKTFPHPMPTFPPPMPTFPPPGR